MSHSEFDQNKTAQEQGRTRRGRFTKPSFIVLWSLCLLIGIVRLSGSTRTAISWDVFGYYLYLPAQFIYNDLALQDHVWLDQVMTTYEPSSTFYQLVDADNGTRVIKYSAGMAVAYAPWFFFAHTIAEPLGFPADGFSAPYRWIVTFGSLIHIFIGLYFFRRILLRFFNEGWTAVVMAVTVLGTNFLQLAAFDGTLITHPLLFTLYAILVFYTMEWHRSPRMIHAALIGGSVGFITLVRPSEAICVVIPLLWATTGGYTAKWNNVMHYPVHVLVALVIGALAVAPQLLYWHTVTGNWVFYSYVNPGEGFDLTSPHTTDFLFSFRKGWFIYTPLMALAIVGFVPLWKHALYVFWPIFVFIILDVFVISSWTNWWYAGGSFSARGIVPAYVLLAVPLGFFMNYFTEELRLKRTTTILVVVLVLLNVFQTWQWMNGVISKERMTADYYAAIFGRTQVPEGAERLLSVGRPTTTIETFEDTTGYSQRTLLYNDYSDRPNGEFLLTQENAFAPGPDVTFAELTKKDHVWVRSTARIFIGETPITAPLMIAAFHHNGEAYKYRALPWKIPENARNEWVALTMDYITPEVRSPKDNLKVYVWDQSGDPIRLDDFRISIYEPLR